ncbi:MAG: CidA/LrgA family protein [Betaproteobacteria bacterium]|nr:CidA/LrgA family protein [Betaproteobacteria bacterium]
MVPGLLLILLFQGLGDLASRFLLPMLPGPVIGLVLLFTFLLVRGRVPVALGTVSGALMNNLGLLFVPAASGVVLFLPQMAAHAWALGVALIASVALTIAVTALVLRALAPRDEAAPPAQEKHP